MRGAGAVEDVGARERGRIADVLEAPPGHERIGAVEEERANREDDHQAEDEQDEDLALLTVACPGAATRGPRCDAGHQ